MALRSRRPHREEEQQDKSIEINAQMQGTLTFQDPVDLKINGQYEGTLDTKGSLTIGSSAQVKANISGDNIVVAGKVSGDITANVMLVLMPTAVLIGNVATPKLNIVEGALFEGHCKMAGGETHNDLLDINEVAKFLEIDLTEIEQLANSGKIPGQKNGDTWKFERDTIESWASSGKLT